MPSWSCASTDWPRTSPITQLLRLTPVIQHAGRDARAVGSSAAQPGCVGSGSTRTLAAMPRYTRSRGRSRLTIPAMSIPGHDPKRLFAATPEFGWPRRRAYYCGTIEPTRSSGAWTRKDHILALARRTVCSWLPTTASGVFESWQHRRNQFSVKASRSSYRSSTSARYRRKTRTRIAGTAQESSARHCGHQAPRALNGSSSASRRRG